KKVYKAIEKRRKMGKNFAIIVVAEGAISKDIAKLPKKEKKAKLAESQYPSIAYEVAHDIQQKYPTAEVRVAVPGHTQRGGNPDAYDRVLSSRFGAKAAELFKEKDFGKLVVFKNNEVTAIPMEESAGKLKYVDPDNQLIQEAKTLGISFGD
ncbi:MAG: 6-phosphofructokinase, partial [Eubacterium sp.]|nr:6-phosphofructokinase [Eubacterium sp.]